MGSNREKWSEMGPIGVKSYIHPHRSLIPYTFTLIHIPYPLCLIQHSFFHIPYPFSLKLHIGKFGFLAISYNSDISETVDF